MDKDKFEIKIFHLFNGITWVVAFLLYTITQQAKPQDVDMFNYGIETQLSRSWNTNLIGIGRWLLFFLCIVCSISFIANVLMSINTKKKFSMSQLIATLLTIWFTFFYFSNF